MTRPSHIFRKEGEYWTIVYDGTVLRLRNTKGLHYLAALLQHPGQRLHASELVAVARDRTVGRATPGTYAAPAPDGDAQSEVAASQLRLGVGDTRPSAGRCHNSPAAERARLSVSKGIKATLEKIASGLPALGAHLAVTIKRGYFCAYTPDPRRPISWVG